MAQDYWWVTRPKRKLNPIPEELAAFSAVALGKKWTHNRELHICFEEELESSGTKRIGERRDASGSGGRTHAAMLYSLGLWFEKNDKVFLTLAGEAILDGKSPIEILKKQVIRFQYPSAYSNAVKVTPRFRIRPFVFLLKLLADDRLENYLTQEEIAYIVAINAENESDRCYESVLRRIIDYRSKGNVIFDEEYFASHQASVSNLMDVSNTMMNWLDYTQLIYRERKIIGLCEDKKDEVISIVNEQGTLLQYPIDSDVYQRKYGVDPWHQKDTRNLLNTQTVSSSSLDRNRILRAFFAYSSLHPVSRIDGQIVDYICNIAGTDESFTERVLIQSYPHGAIGGYLSNYRDMAFQGRDEAVDFEKATTNLFAEVFGYTSKHLGQLGAKSAPDVLLISDSESYQAIIDNKAYSKYSISGDHHNRMVHNYLGNIGSYSQSVFPIGFFTYISGGFATNINAQLLREHEESGVNGSCITVSNLIYLIESHMENAFTHKELKDLFGCNRQIMLSDIRSH